MDYQTKALQNTIHTIEKVIVETFSLISEWSHTIMGDAELKKLALRHVPSRVLGKLKSIFILPLVLTCTSVACTSSLCCSDKHRCRCCDDTIVQGIGMRWQLQKKSSSMCCG